MVDVDVDDDDGDGRYFEIVLMVTRILMARL